jgi:hypothetical protein
MDVPTDIHRHPVQPRRKTPLLVERSQSPVQFQEYLLSGIFGIFVSPEQTKGDPEYLPFVPGHQLVEGCQVSPFCPHQSFVGPRGRLKIHPDGQLPSFHFISQ